MITQAHPSLKLHVTLARLCTITRSHHHRVHSVDNYSSDSISVLFSNCRSLLPKIDQLCLQAFATNADIVCIVETWLDATILNAEIYIPGYQIVRKDRNHHGGGILLYVKTSIPVLNHFLHPNLELLTVEIRVQNKCLTTCLFYRPPNANPHCLQELKGTLDHLSPSKLKTLMLEETLTSICTGLANFSTSWSVSPPSMASHRWFKTQHASPNIVPALLTTSMSLTPH